ncbi:MAG: SDR family oxidoreductase [Novosphingobium sp.]
MQGRVSIDCSGQKVIVTGGSRGIGRAIAERFVANGAHVAICGRTPLAEPIEGALFHALDIRDPDQAAAFVDAVADEFGGLDVLVNNAGGSPEAPASEASPRFIEAVVRLNLLAPMNLARAAHRHMAAEGWGSIVNIASVSGTRPSPGTAAYGAAKAGLLNATQTLAQEWGPQGIRVNAIVAGLMATETADQTYGDDAAQSRIAASLPLGRMGTGGDIADTVVWLCSDAANWVSGARINVDGGGERPLFLELLKGN